MKLTRGGDILSLKLVHHKTPQALALATRYFLRTIVHGGLFGQTFPCLSSFRYIPNSKLYSDKDMRIQVAMSNVLGQCDAMLFKVA